jgi:hypothetical protein
MQRSGHGGAGAAVVDMARFYRLVWSMSRVIKKKL